MMHVEINWAGAKALSDHCKNFNNMNKNRKTSLVKKIKYSLISLFLAFFYSFSVSAAAPTVEDIQKIQELKLGEEIVEDETYTEIQTSTTKTEEECPTCIYGYNFFRSTPTTFALSSNVPVSPDYVLGPGDKLLVELYGNNSNKKDAYISRTGAFNLPLIGPISLVGLTLSKAEEIISAKVKNELIGTEVYITLSEMRSINVYVVGAAYKPGTYTVSSMASLTNIVFASGGPNTEGSLRNIQVKRKGVTLSEYDFYDLILNGDTSKDIRLQEGDTIFYPLIENTIRIDGAVQRPGFYEFKQGDTVSSILKYSGIKNRSKIKVELSRYDVSQDKRMVSIYENLSDPKLQEMLIVDDDSYSIISSKNVTSSTVRLGGEFLFPGFYDISSGETILGIIQKAGGMTEEAYPEASIFTREMVKQQQKSSFMKNADNLERSLLDAVATGSTIDGEAYIAMIEFINRLREVEPTGRQVVSVDSYSLRSDPKYNFALQDGDVLIVPKRSPSISVVGEVLNTTTHIYDEDLSIDDYIQLSGGTTDGADLSKIFVILPNGQSAQYKRRLFQNDISSKLLPGSTIVVSRNPDPFDWLQLTSIITPVLSDLAVSAAAIAAISNNN